MPVSPEQSENSERAQQVLRYIESKIDEQLGAGRIVAYIVLAESPLELHYLDITKTLEQRLIDNYLQVGWKNVKIGWTPGSLTILKFTFEK